MRLPDRNESKRKGERTCANFAHARRQTIEPPVLSGQSIIGATQKRRAAAAEAMAITLRHSIHDMSLA
jgi:hypothetical protein